MIETRWISLHWGNSFFMEFKKQPSHSSCEVEYVAGTSCISHLILLRNFRKELNIPQEEPTRYILITSQQ